MDWDEGVQDEDKFFNITTYGQQGVSFDIIDEEYHSTFEKYSNYPINVDILLQIFR
jgi:hypothetical protein